MVNWVDHVEGTTEGTPVNRANLMAMQGFESTTTTFNSDGSITETNLKGETLVAHFESNGDIVETFTGANGMTITKRTSFLDNGDIIEAVSD